MPTGPLYDEINKLKAQGGQKPQAVVSPSSQSPRNSGPLYDEINRLKQEEEKRRNAPPAIAPTFQETPPEPSFASQAYQKTSNAIKTAARATERAVASPTFQKMSEISEKFLSGGAKVLEVPFKLAEKGIDAVTKAVTVGPSLLPGSPLSEGKPKPTSVKQAYKQAPGFSEAMKIFFNNTLKPIYDSKVVKDELLRIEKDPNSLRSITTSLLIGAPEGLTESAKFVLSGLLIEGFAREARPAMVKTRINQAENFVKKGVEKVVPEAYLQREVTKTFTPDQIRDTFAGREPTVPEVLDYVKKLSSAEKSALAKQVLSKNPQGVVLRQVEPTKLGKFFGIEAKEAQAIVKEANRQTARAFLEAGREPVAAAAPVLPTLREQFGIKEAPGVSIKAEPTPGVEYKPVEGKQPPAQVIELGTTKTSADTLRQELSGKPAEIKQEAPKEKLVLEVQEIKLPEITKETISKRIKGEGAGELENYDLGSMYTKLSNEEYALIDPELAQQIGKQNKFPVAENEKLPPALKEKIVKMKSETNQLLEQGKYELKKTPTGYQIQLENGIITDLKIRPGAKPEITKPEFGRSDLKTLVDNSPEFKKSPVFVVQDRFVDGKTQKRLVFEGEKNRFEINADALGLQSKNLKIGDVIELDPATLKIKGDNIRVTKVGPGGTRTAYATKGATPISGFEHVTGPEKVAAPAGTPQFKLFEQVEGFIRKYAERMGEGYLPRNARGVFYPNTKNIFVEGLNSVSVASHETVHYVDQARHVTDSIISNTKRGADIRDELTRIYEQYYPGGRADHPLKKRLTEGLATFIQKYVEQPSTIEAQYPKLVNAFLKEGGQFYHQVFNDMVSDLRSLISDYQNLSALDKIGARMANLAGREYPEQKILNLKDKIRTELADNVYPLEVLAMKSGKAMTENDISLFARMYNNINAPIINNISGKRGYWQWKNGNFEKKYDFNWGTLVKQMEQKGVTEPFGSYLTARDTHFQYERLQKLQDEVELAKENLAEAVEPEEIKSLKTIIKETGKKVEALSSVLEREGISKGEAKEAYEQNKELFRDEEKMFDQLERADLDFLHDPDVQLLNGNDYHELAGREGYAPRKREFYNEIIGEPEIPKVSRTGKSTKPSSLLRRKGSERAILHPVYSGIRNHAEIMKKGFRQMVYNRVPDTAQQFPDLFQRIELKAVPNADGSMSFPQTKDPNVIMARMNYKRVPFVVNDAIVRRTLDDVLNFQNFNYFEKIALAMSRVFTKGTTAAYAPFAGTNYVVDQLTGVTNTMNNYVPIYDSLKLIFKGLADKGEIGRLFEEYMVLGGERQTMVGWQNMSQADLLKTIGEETDKLRKVVGLIDKGVDILSLPSKYSEIITRATEYIKSRQAGNSQMVALEQAGRATAPFHHVGRLGGRSGQVYIKSIPFFNPAIQVLDQAFRTLETPAGRKRYLMVAAAVTAAIAATGYNIMKNATSEQKQQYKDLQPELLTKYLYIPKDDGKGLIRVRIPETLSVPGAIVNMVIADQLLGTKYTAGDYSAVSTAFLPDQTKLLTDPTEWQRGVTSLIPQILKPAIMLAFGKKDFPKILDIESQTLKRIPSQFRYTEQTSSLAKWIGKQEWAKSIDLSPVKIDFLITGYLGRATGFVTDKPGVWNPLSVFESNYYFENGRTMQRYYKIKSEVEQDASAIRKGLELNLTDEQKQKRATQDAQVKYIDKLLDFYKKIDLEKHQKEAIEVREKILKYADMLDD